MDARLFALKQANGSLSVHIVAIDGGEGEPA